MPGFEVMSDTVNVEIYSVSITNIIIIIINRPHHISMPNTGKRTVYKKT
jgi:hypothetical protein